MTTTTFSLCSAIIPQEQVTDCLICAVYHGGELSPITAELNQASDSTISRIIQQGDLQDKLGATLLLQTVPNLQATRVLLVNCGNSCDELNVTDFYKIIRASCQALQDLNLQTVSHCLADLSVENCSLEWKIRHIVEILLASQYRFDHYKSKKPQQTDVSEVQLVVNEVMDHEAEALAIKQGQAIGLARAFCRNLVNEPANVCTPTYLAETAQQLATDYATIKTTVLEKKQMASLGMNALLSVSLGSDHPPKLITLEYKGPGHPKKPIVLVGKGVTFDSGGLCIKPAAGMDDMKCDMGGAASVLGTLKAIAELNLPLHVIGVIPSVENLLGGSAYKPSDIITSMSGQTIEMINTDAEGRMLLCDALTYSEKFDPELVIDIATLTGAIIVSLGTQASGLFTQDDALAERLLNAGETSHDRLWRLPLWDSYQVDMDSKIADMVNSGPRRAGSVLAACFLARFTKKYRWAHLDIAGTAWKNDNDFGASGRPVPCLTQFLIDSVEK